MHLLLFNMSLPYTFAPLANLSHPHFKLNSA